MIRGIIWLFLPVLIGCQDDADIKPKDPRDAWVGLYKGEKTSTFWTMNQPSTSHTDTFSIQVSKATDTLGYLLIGGERVLPDIQGYVSLGYSSGWRLWELQLGNDSLKLNTASGGLGGGTNTSYRAKRQP